MGYGVWFGYVMPYCTRFLNPYDEGLRMWVADRIVCCDREIMHPKRSKQKQFSRCDHGLNQPDSFLQAPR